MVASAERGIAISSGRLVRKAAPRRTSTRPWSTSQPMSSSKNSALVPARRSSHSSSSGSGGASRRASMSADSDFVPRGSRVTSRATR